MESFDINDSQNDDGSTTTLNSTSARTWNNALSNPSPDPSGETAGRVALFFKSVRGIENERLQEYLAKASAESLRDAFLIAFHIRDCRGGKGEREIGRKCLRWLSRDAQRFEAIIPHIAGYGRWDDYLTLIQASEKPKPSRKAKKSGKDAGAPDTFPAVTNERLVGALVLAFAQQLKSDRQAMNEGKPCTLAAKWAPTENCSLDRKYNLVERICRILNISKRDYRREYVAPLRAYLKVVERYMCHKNWDAIDYSSVPSCAMKRLKKAFAKNDGSRFEEWKSKLQKGEVKVNAKQLYPHELVREVAKSDDNVVSEAQWKVLVEETKKLGVFGRSLVVVDVSGSMGSMKSGAFCPMHASVALGLIISECLEGPLKNHIITFHEEPAFYKVQGTSLKERIHSLVHAPWGGSTNFQSVFRLILGQARKFGLKQEDMPETLYILSDMQFNSAMKLNEGNEKSNYVSVLEQYKEAGYSPPNIIFWNLNGSSTDFPCTTNDYGTAMISGFSTAILKSILTLGKVDPYSTLRATIEAERYLPIAQALQPFEPTPEVKKPEGTQTATAKNGWLSGWF